MTLITTPRWALPQMPEHGPVRNGDLYVNEMIATMALCGQCEVLDRDLTAPPGSEVNGQIWIPAATATGAWAGQEGKLAAFLNGYRFITIPTGGVVSIKDENLRLVYDGMRLAGLEHLSRKESTLSPANGLEATIWQTEHPLRLDSMWGILRGSSSPDVQWTLRYATDRSAAGTEAKTSGITTTSTTTVHVEASLDNRDVPAGAWLWWEITAAPGGTVDEFTGGFRGRYA